MQKIFSLLFIFMLFNTSLLWIGQQYENITNLLTIDFATSWLNIADQPRHEDAQDYPDEITGKTDHCSMINSECLSSNGYLSNKYSPFQEKFTTIEGGMGSVALADYNKDKYMDVLVTGPNSNYDPFTMLYKNIGNGNFKKVDTPFEWVDGAAGWADYDNDDDPDVLITGFSSNDSYISKLYQNNNDGTFSEVINLPFAAVGGEFVAWEDYNGDTYLDLLILGYDQNRHEHVCKLYQNKGNGTFSEVETPFEQVMYGSAMWADYDNDNDQDVLIIGSVEGIHFERPSTRLYQNNGDGTFSEVVTPFDPVEHGAAAWADYDNDNDQDVLITGVDTITYFEGPVFSRIINLYKNNGDGTFDVVKISFKEVGTGSLSWIDVNNDGDLEIFIAGASTGSHIHDYDSYINALYQYNEDGTFSQIYIPFPGGNGIAAWADFDLNGYIDVLIPGVSKIYLNIPDTEPPTISLETNLDTEMTLSFYLRIYFSEKVLGFTLNDLNITGGAIEDFGVSSDFAEATIYPDLSGTVTINVDAGSVTDLAGNPSVAAEELRLQVSGIKDLYVYPVPTRYQLDVVFQLEKPSKVWLEIVNMNGQSVFQKTLGVMERVRETWFLDNLTNGLYNLHVYVDDVRHTKRIIINR